MEADQAAALDQTGLRQGRRRDHDARAERGKTDGAVRLLRDHVANLESGFADLQRVPRYKLKPGRESRIHHRTVSSVPLRQFRLDGAAFLQVEGAEQRIGVTHRFQLDQGAPVRIRLARHGPHFDGLGNRARLAEPVDLFGCRFAMGEAYIDIAAEDLPCIPLDPRHHGGGDGTDTGHRRHAEGEAGQKHAEGGDRAAQLPAGDRQGNKEILHQARCRSAAALSSG